jgi:uncharacterized protein YjiS (DUF1127 family)
LEAETIQTAEVAMTNGHDSTPKMWWAQHAAERFARGLSAAVDGAVDAIEAQRRRCALEQQLNALDARGMADIGITREQIPAVASAYPEAPLLLRRMMDRIGAAPEALLRDGALRREMEWNCVACANRSQCRRWLKSAVPADAYRTFCPNADGLDRLAAAERGSG